MRHVKLYDTLHNPRLVSALYFVLALSIGMIYILFGKINSNPPCPYVWHGGSPSHQGSCWCGLGNYCMCTPSLAIDAIIEFPVISNNKVIDLSFVLVMRSDIKQPTHAIPGGFVNIGETVEETAIREVKEETNLDIVHLEQFRVYSNPNRDKRRHTVSCVFRCVVNSTLNMHKGDDAKEVVVVPLSELGDKAFAFDHSIILRDYIKRYHPHLSSAF